MVTPFEEIKRRNRELSDKLLGLSGVEPPPSIKPPQNADAIVAHIEINNRHGVGVLLQRLFREFPDILSIRSKDYYEGRQDFGAVHVCISHDCPDRDQIIWKVLQAVDGGSVRRILAVPYFADDALNALALREAFGAPLCTYLMDDQNVHASGIPDAIMRELLGKSSLRLAISPEMCTAYEAKFGHKIWFVPPLAPTRLIPRQASLLPEHQLRGGQPVILGNIWGQRWLELLRSTVSGSGISVRWYNNGEFRWLPCSHEELARDGILTQTGGGDSDEELVEILRQAPYVVLPSGTLDHKDDRRFIAQLSFPSRIPFILATSQTPILVLGHPDTAAARLVERFGIGMNTAYRQNEFLEAAGKLTQPEVNNGMRRRAFLLAPRFSDLGAAEWIWESLEKGKPVDGRYQEMAEFRGFPSAAAAASNGNRFDSPPPALEVRIK
jgi:hypothetical protein